VTATSRSDVINGWQARRAEGGIVIDVASGAVVTEKLSMPHSPRWYDNQLWLLNSGSGHLGTVDLASGSFAPRAFCPGFLRGPAFHNGHAVVGLSLSRDGSFSGLALDDEIEEARRRRLVRRADRDSGFRRHRAMDPHRGRGERALRRRGAAGRAQADGGLVHRPRNQRAHDLRGVKPYPEDLPPSLRGALATRISKSLN